MRVPEPSFKFLNIHHSLGYAAANIRIHWTVGRKVLNFKKTSTQAREKFTAIYTTVAGIRIYKFGSKPAADKTTLSPLIAAVSVANWLLPLNVSPYVVINAFVPSCTTSASTVCVSVFESLSIKIKYFYNINSFLKRSQIHIFFNQLKK